MSEEKEVKIQLKPVDRTKEGPEDKHRRFFDMETKSMISSSLMMSVNVMLGCFLC